MKFLQTMKAKIGAFLSLGLLGVTQASAALTATDVDMSTASADVTVVVIAIIGLLVVIFGFRKVLGLLGR